MWYNKMFLPKAYGLCAPTIASGTFAGPTHIHIYQHPNNLQDWQGLAQSWLVSLSDYEFIPTGKSTD